MQRGIFRRLLIGGMCSNKTGFLLLEIETLRAYGRKTVLVLKPTTDTRSGRGFIKSRNGSKMEALEVPDRSPWSVLDILREEERKMGIRYDVIAFDEIQFFGVSSGCFELINELLNRGYDMLATGLPVNFRGEPFGITTQLTWLAQGNCKWLESYCTVCGEVALFSQRLIDGVPASYESEEILVGDQVYEPRCHEHFIVPNCPYPPAPNPVL